MGTNGKKLSSSGLELHIELILNGNRSTDGEITPLNITNVNEQLGVFDKELGDIVKHHIFRDAQDTYRLLSEVVCADT